MMLTRIIKAYYESDTAVAKELTIIINQDNSLYTNLQEVETRALQDLENGIFSEENFKKSLRYLVDVAAETFVRTYSPGADVNEMFEPKVREAALELLVKSFREEYKI